MILKGTHYGKILINHITSNNENENKLENEINQLKSSMKIKEKENEVKICNLQKQIREIT